MSGRDRTIVVEARHTARLAASRAQVLAAEVDLDLCAAAMGMEVSHVERDEAGIARGWTQVARRGGVREEYRSSLVGRDPVITVSEHRSRGGTAVQTSVTTVDLEQGSDGRIGVVWTLRIEVDPRWSLFGFSRRLTGAVMSRGVARQFGTAMVRWGHAIEAHAAGPGAGSEDAGEPV